MIVQHILPPQAIALLVKEILVFEESEVQKMTVLPFYADGYPGIMFQQTAAGLYVMPQEKAMPVFFLYGQTIHPIELLLEGPFSLLVFQLYPFVLKSLFGLSPKDLNDGCYDLQLAAHANAAATIQQLNSENNLQQRVDTIALFLEAVFLQRKDQLDFKIGQAIRLIADSRGLINIGALCKQLKINERSFERRFMAQVGVSPKQLAKIFQFDASLQQLNDKDFSRLTDIVYGNGFADQSHFIRVFKAFTGTTPGRFGDA